MHPLHAAIREKNLQIIRAMCREPNHEEVREMAGNQLATGKDKSLITSGSPISEDIINTYLEYFVQLV